jgi:hypothetical protein
MQVTILPVILYGRETSSVNVRVERRFRKVVNRAPRRILEYSEEVRESCIARGLIILTRRKSLLGDQIKECEISRACSTHDS